MHKNNVCWICQQPNRNRKFKPCHCKGSMAFVHRTCINTWATEQYQKNKSEIQCPNCKFDYSYEISEKWLSFRQLRLCESIEQTILILLTVTQIIVSCFDLLSISEEEQVQFTLLSYVNTLHFAIIVILLIAAIYNIIDMGLRSVELQILNHNT